MLRIYVASSWRNDFVRNMVESLRQNAYDVYDFTRPSLSPGGSTAFRWDEIDPGWQDWDAETFRKSLNHPTADRGFAQDMRFLDACDVCILLLPCGRSAHLEAGYAKGRGKSLIVWIGPNCGKVEPELMYKIADAIVINYDELGNALAEAKKFTGG
jgi:hypothetical protein